MVKKTRILALIGWAGFSISLVACSASAERGPTPTIFIAPDCTILAFESCESALLMFDQDVGPPIGPLGSFRRVDIGDVSLIGRIAPYGCANLTLDVAFNGLSPEGWPLLLTEDGVKPVNLGPATLETATLSFRLNLNQPAVSRQAEPCT